MRVRACTLLSLIAVLTLTSQGHAQNRRTVRWELGQPNSTRFARRDAVLEQLIVKELKVDGITVTASIRDGFSVELSITNGSQRSLDIKPDRVSLEVVKPQSRMLPYQSPEWLARAAQ